MIDPSEEEQKFVMDVLGRSEISASAKVLASVLTFFFPEKSVGELDPTIDELMEATAQSRSTVKRSTAELERCGAISVDRGKSRGTPNLYELIYDFAVQTAD